MNNSAPNKKFLTMKLDKNMTKLDDDTHLLQFLTKEEKMKLFKKLELGSEFQNFLSQMQDEDDDNELAGLNDEIEKKELRHKNYKLRICETKEYQAYSLDEVLPSM